MRYNEAEAKAAEALKSIPQPTIGLIHGPCIGGGLNLALCTDVRYAGALRRTQALSAAREPASQHIQPPLSLPPCPLQLRVSSMRLLRTDNSVLHCIPLLARVQPKTRSSVFPQPSWVSAFRSR